MVSTPVLSESMLMSGTATFKIGLDCVELITCGDDVTVMGSLDWELMVCGLSNSILTYG